MAEYIDRNLIEWYGCDFEDASCENRECSGCSHAECFQPQVMQIPTADVIERYKIDKAILVLKREQNSEFWNSSFRDGIDYALKLLKKNVDMEENNK